MDFLDFIKKAQSDPRLLMGFVQCNTDGELETFFRTEGVDVTVPDRAKILEAKKNYERLGVYPMGY